MDAGEFWSAVPAKNSQVNVGCGEDVSIAELASLVAGVTGFNGQIVFDLSRPDGTPQKLLDTSRIRAMGWSPRISLREGIEQTYDWMRAHLGTDGREVRTDRSAS